MRQMTPSASTTAPRPRPSWWALLAACALGGCMIAPMADFDPPPEAAPAPEAEGPSEESRSFARYYRTVEARLLGEGLLRTDGGGPDTPFTAAQLAANFERIALFDEYTLSGGRFVQRQTPSILRRWSGPVRLQAHFGDSLTEDKRRRDAAELDRYASRLARITGHPIRTVTSGGNFHVFYVNRDEQAEIGPLVRRLVPGIGAATINEMERLPRFTFCSVYAFSQTARPANYVAAVAIIRDEHPDLLRQSCVHEEIAQGLGLPNDSPAARPSIFNDDEEFALLTRHDEMLLQMLYDPRLTPGLRAEEATPIIQQIAAELVGGPS